MREHAEERHPDEPTNDGFDEPTPTINESVIDGTGREVQSPMFSVVNTHGDRATRRSAVLQAIGAASVTKAGSQASYEVAEGLLDWLDEDDRRRIGGSADELDTFREISATSKRLRDKIEAEPEPSLGIFDRVPWERWRQLDDGTYVSDRAGSPPGFVVVVERSTPADLPMIHVVGRMQVMNPAAVRWLSLRLAEATAIVETAVIP